MLDLDKGLSITNPHGAVSGGSTKGRAEIVLDTRLDGQALVHSIISDTCHSLKQCVRRHSSGVPMAALILIERIARALAEGAAPP